MAKVVRVVKRVHISGRWPTSRQYRFRRYVQRAMPNVVGRQRIKRARSAPQKAHCLRFFVDAAFLESPHLILQIHTKLLACLLLLRLNHACEYAAALK